MGMNIGGRRFTTGDMVLGIALLVALISIFLPWYSASFNCGGSRLCAGFDTSTSVGGLSYWSGWLFFIAVLLGIALYVVRTLVPTMKLPALPQTDAVIFMILGAFMLLMAVLWLLIGSGAGISGPGYSAGPSFGLYVGIIASVAVIVGGYLKRADAQLAPVRAGSGSGGGYAGGAYGGPAQPPPPPGPTYGGGTTPPPPAAP